MADAQGAMPFPVPPSWGSEWPGIVTTAGPAPEGDGFVVVLEGDLDLASAGVVRRRLLELLSLPIRRVVVDLDGLTFMDSSGLAALCAARESAVDQGIAFSLLRLPAQARRVMDLTDTLGQFVVESEGATPAA